MYQFSTGKKKVGEIEYQLFVISWQFFHKLKMLVKLIDLLYRVLEGFRFNIGKGSKMIIFGSLLATFQVSIFLMPLGQ